MIPCLVFYIVFKIINLTNLEIDSEDKNTRWELSSSDNLSSYDNIQNLLIKLKSLK